MVRMYQVPALFEHLIPDKHTAGWCQDIGCQEKDLYSAMLGVFMLGHLPPPWMSITGPMSSCIIALHSMCQPGLPGPQGLSHEGSFGLPAFHSTKSAGCLLLTFTATLSPALLSSCMQRCTCQPSSIVVFSCESLAGNTGRMKRLHVQEPSLTNVRPERRPYPSMLSIENQTLPSAS